MEKKQAIQLISDTFNAKFDENQFSLFIKNLLNDIEPKTNRYSGQMLWDDYKDHINSYKRIGKYTDPEGEPLDVLIVEVKTIAKLERARTSLRNFVIKHLKKFEKDFALVAFYAEEDKGTDWRFSFIKLEHQSYFDEEKDKVKIKEALTPAKRYSFLVGEFEQSHTAKTQLLPLLQNLANNPTVEELENAFSIEKVTDEFFSQYKDLFKKLSNHFEEDIHIKTELNKAKIDNARFTKKLLGQIVFLYFLQKKGWLGVPQNEKWGKGQKRFIQNLFDTAEQENLNFFKDKLQYLFYEALAKERNNEHSFYEKFNCRIPFLNGGLFEAEYKWETANISIPTSIFRNQEKNKAGDIGTGVLDVFDRYNFTIKEDEPLDKEVAVDPEMLGKVFENMLEITERKSKGAFYTPREIVHYMCQESLIHYLDNALDGTVKKEDIETYIRKGHNALENDQRVAKKGEETARYKYILPKSIRKNADLIDQKLTKIKICDPAIGSGAFPVGLLHELVNAQLVIKPHFTDKYLNTKLAAFDFTKKDKPSESRYIYRLKRHIIQESIYGVDIDASAIDIARLRLWLSLVVDEDDFDPIETLPNLDYKIVCGNSLISRYPLDMPIDNVFKEFNKKLKSKDYKNQKIKDYVKGKKIDLSYYKKLTTDFLLESSHDKKVLFRELISEIKQSFKTFFEKKREVKLQKMKTDLNLFETENLFGNNKSVKEKQRIKAYKKEIAKLEKERQDTQANTLYKNAIEWRFEFPNLLDKDGDFIGFDVVIGNPPYVGEKGNKEIFRPLQKVFIDRYEKNSDLLYFFFMKSIDLLINKGHLAFITTNYYLTADGAIKLRNDFKNKIAFCNLINFNETKVFENALGQHNIITILEKTTDILDTNIVNIVSPNNVLFENIFTDSEDVEVFTLKSNLLFEGKSNFIRISKKANELENVFIKMKTNSKTIEEICIINTGFNSGADRVTKSNLIKVDSSVSENINSGIFVINEKEYKYIKPEKELTFKCFKSSDISKYGSNSWQNLYVIWTNKEVEIERFPNIKKHLDEYRSFLELKREYKTGQLPWYSQHWPREIELFSNKDKIVFPYRSKSNIFSYSDGNYFGSKDILYLRNKDANFQMKYILALLNSQLYYLWLYYKGKRKGETLELYVTPMSQVPIKEIPTPEQVPFITIVDYIITLKSAIHNSSFTIHNSYFEAVIDAMVYELYFEQELKQAGKEVLKHLTDLIPINDEMSEEEKLAIIQAEFERLYHPEHPVRFAVETLDSIEEVRIIKEALR